MTNKMTNIIKQQLALQFVFSSLLKKKKTIQTKTQDTEVSNQLRNSWRVWKALVVVGGFVEKTWKNKAEVTWRYQDPGI